jgi:hypothetical protein
MNLTWKEQRLAAEAYRRDTIRMRIVGLLVVLTFAWQVVSA